MILSENNIHMLKSAQKHEFRPLLDALVNSFPHYKYLELKYKYIQVVPIYTVDVNKRFGEFIEPKSELKLSISIIT